MKNSALLILELAGIAGAGLGIYYLVHKAGAAAVAPAAAATGGTTATSGSALTSAGISVGTTAANDLLGFLFGNGNNSGSTNSGSGTPIQQAGATAAQSITPSSAGSGNLDYLAALGL
ncbi:MAG: hypothetical protein KGJ13_07020 [Patescibacteria group bacterium]|nr:hypothetical protein [Patescibacteria group bacterium]